MRFLAATAPSLVVAAASALMVAGLLVVRQIVDGDIASVSDFLGAHVTHGVRPLSQLCNCLALVCLADDRPALTCSPVYPFWRRRVRCVPSVLKLAGSSQRSNSIFMACHSTSVIENHAVSRLRPL